MLRKNQRNINDSIVPVGKVLNQWLIRHPKIKAIINNKKTTEIIRTIITKDILKYIKSIEIRNEKLYLKTELGVIKNELLFQKKNIISKFNENNKYDLYIKDVLIN